MLYGVGTDIVAIARMVEALARHGNRFAERILAPSELNEFHAARDGARFLAKRFAAKEAFAKALGTGLRAPATLSAIAVTHNVLGKPELAFADDLSMHLQSLGLRAHLSISDERDHVVAFSVLEHVV